MCVDPPPTFSLTQPQIIDLLSRMHPLGASRPNATRGRLQHFQKLGFPEGTNVGRGRRAHYGAGEIIRLLVAFELLQLGLTPERAISIIRSSRHFELPFVDGVAGVPAGEGGGEHWVAIIKPNALADAASEEHLSFSVRSSMLNLLAIGEWRCWAIIDVTAMIIAAGRTMEGAGFCEAPSFDAAVRAWGEAALLRKAM